LRQTLIGYSSVPESTRVRGVERLPNADFAEYVPSLGTTPPWSCLTEDRIAGLGPRDLTKLGNFPYFFPIHFDVRTLFFKSVQFSTFQSPKLGLNVESCTNIYSHPPLFQNGGWL